MISPRLVCVQNAVVLMSSSPSSLRVMVRQVGMRGRGVCIAIDQANVGETVAEESGRSS